MKKNDPAGKIRAEIRRLEAALFSGMARMYEPEINNRKREIEALRKVVGDRAPRRRRQSRKVGPGQGVLFK